MKSKTILVLKQRMSVWLHKKVTTSSGSSQIKGIEESGSPKLVGLYKHPTLSNSISSERFEHGLSNRQQMK